MMTFSRHDHFEERIEGKEDIYDLNKAAHLLSRQDFVQKIENCRAVFYNDKGLTLRRNWQEGLGKYYTPPVLQGKTNLFKGKIIWGLAFL